MKSSRLVPCSWPGEVPVGSLTANSKMPEAGLSSAAWAACTSGLDDPEPVNVRTVVSPTTVGSAGAQGGTGGGKWPPGRGPGAPGGRVFHLAAPVGGWGGGG